MPIRFVDKTSVVAGRIQPTLAAHTALFSGTFSVAAASTGSVASILGNHAAAISGTFASNASRIGTIGVTLEDNASAFSGSFASAGNQSPVWATLADQNLLVGTPFSLDLDSICNDPEGQPLTYTIVSGTLPAGIAQSGTRGQTISGTPTSVGTVSITFKADDSFNNADSDFEDRATAPGVLYATNFTDVYLDSAKDASRSGIASTQDIYDEANDHGGEIFFGSNNGLQRDTSIKLSGTGSMRLDTFDISDKSATSFIFTPNGRDTTLYPRLYAQVSIYLPRPTLAYRWSSTSDTMQKFMNFGQAGAGQLVVGQSLFSGFPYLLLNQNQSISDNTGTGSYTGSQTPWGITTSRSHTAIDNGATLTGSSSKAAWLNNYGPMLRGWSIQDADTSYSASQPYMDLRNFANGWPDARMLASGTQPWVLDGWTTFGVFIEFAGAAGSQSSIQLVACEYGEAPIMLVNEIGTVDFQNGNGDSSPNSWDHLELLNYATGRLAEPGVRPTLRTYYGEVIISESPIEFPGGFPWPDNQG